MSDYRARIRATRDAQGLSAQKLVDLMGERGHAMHRSALTQAELGNRGLNVEELLAIADVLGVPADELLLGETGKCPHCRAQEVRARAAALRAEADRIEREAGLS